MRAIITFLSLLSWAWLVSCFGDYSGIGVVGYQDLGTRGVYTNTTANFDGSDVAVSGIFQGVVDRTELDIYNGEVPLKSVIAIDDGDSLHWHDRTTNELADDCGIPVGFVIHYRQPEGCTTPLMVSGPLVSRSFLVNEPLLSEIRISPEDMKNVVGHSTDDHDASNGDSSSVRPTRFIVRMVDNTIRHAKYDYEKDKIVDANTGDDIAVSASSVQRFEVDNDPKIKASDRFDAKQLDGLQGAYLREYQQTKERKVQENVAKGFMDAFFSKEAVIPLIIAAAVTFCVTKVMHGLWIALGLCLSWLRRKLGRLLSRARGWMLYHKTHGIILLGVMVVCGCGSNKRAAVVEASIPMSVVSNALVKAT